MEIERHHECLHTLEPKGFQQEKGEWQERRVLHRRHT